MALKHIKGQIRSVDKTHKVTRAMEAVSAVKMRKSQAVALLGRPYARAAMTILSRVSDSSEVARHPLAKERPVTRALYAVVTSDKGLAGSLNSAILKEATKKITQSGLPKENISLITLGRKASDYFEKRGYTIVQRFDNVADDISAEEMRSITDIATTHFLEGKSDMFAVMYTNFLSTLTQQPVSRTLLPLTAKTLQEIVTGITPERGRFSDDVTEMPVPVATYLVEPSEDVVLSTVLPLLLNVGLYHALLESKASEHSARMVAMKNASEKAKEISEDLTHLLNKQRQALITREVSEIIGGIEAMSN